MLFASVLELFLIIISLERVLLLRPLRLQTRYCKEITPRRERIPLHQTPRMKEPHKKQDNSWEKKLPELSSYL